MPPDVVVCSLEPWDDVWRRNQYLVDHLLRERPDARVLFVEPATDTWRPRFDGGSRLRPGPPAPVGATGRLWRFTPRKPLPRVSGPLADVAIRRQVRRAASVLGLTAPVVWLNDLALVPLVRATGWPALYDVTDDWLAETTVPARVLRRRRRLEAWALAHCAEVVVCSPTLARSKGEGRPVTLVPNGVDVELFTTPQPRPDDLPEGPTAVYVGTLHDERTDVGLVAELARHEPRLSVVLVGPDALGEDSRRALVESGAMLLGPRPHRSVPGYLQHADVVVVPHAVNAFTESLDPIKAYECLAVGTPTVATQVAGFRGLGDPVVVASREEFVDAVARAAAERGDRHSALPEDATWSARGARFLERLDATAPIAPSSDPVR